MHDEEVVLMTPGRRVAFSFPATGRERVLYVHRPHSGGLRIRAKGPIIGAIRGPGFAAKVQPPVPSTQRDTYVLIELADGDLLRLATPESRGIACVYLDAIDGAVHLIGGSSLVDVIEGDGLAPLVEDAEADDAPVSHVSPRAAQSLIRRGARKKP